MLGKILRNGNKRMTKVETRNKKQETKQNPSDPDKQRSSCFFFFKDVKEMRENKATWVWVLD